MAWRAQKVYGCSISRLQTTVRTFYGIDGGDLHDCFDGHCCPCVALMRAEQEIILRERHHKRLRYLNEPDGSVMSQYQSSRPMTYTTTGSTSQPLKSATSMATRQNAPHTTAQPKSTGCQQPTGKVPLVYYQNRH